MTWEGHPRTSTAAWRQIRRTILGRSDICHVCGRPGATEVDHLIPHAEGGTDELANLAPIHPRPCHQLKTQEEAARARWRHQAQRPAEPHPGMR